MDLTMCFCCPSCFCDLRGWLTVQEYHNSHEEYRVKFNLIEYFLSHISAEQRCRVLRFSSWNMDLRYECMAIENVTAPLPTLVEKTLDNLEMIPSFIDRAEKNEVNVEDIKKLEQTVGLTLSNLSKLYRKVQAIEDLLYYIIRNAEARGTLKTMPTPPPMALTVKINSDNEENKVDGCTDAQLDCSVDQKALEHVENEAELRMKEDAPQRGRRRSRSAVRLIKKVSRRLSLSRSRFPRAEKAGEFDADSTLPVER